MDSKNLICTHLFLLTFFLVCSSVYADWSPEILLWEPPANTMVGPYEAAMVVDPMGGVHIIFRVHFRLASEPSYMHGGVSYVKYDDHGNRLAGPTSA